MAEEPDRDETAMDPGETAATQSEQPSRDPAKSAEEQKALELSESARYGYVMLPTDSAELIDHQALAPDGGEQVQLVPTDDAGGQADTPPAEGSGEE